MLEKLYEKLNPYMQYFLFKCKKNNKLYAFSKFYL